MLHSSDIKRIFEVKIPKGTTLTVTQIQNLVKDNFQLTEQDWEIHTKTRSTNYRRWLHRVQAVLSEYKKKGLVKHKPSTNSYTF